MMKMKMKMKMKNQTIDMTQPQAQQKPFNLLNEIDYLFQAFLWFRFGQDETPQKLEESQLTPTQKIEMKLWKELILTQVTCGEAISWEQLESKLAEQVSIAADFDWLKKDYRVRQYFLEKLHFYLNTLKQMQDNLKQSRQDREYCQKRSPHDFPRYFDHNSIPPPKVGFVTGSQLREPSPRPDFHLSYGAEVAKNHSPKLSPSLEVAIRDFINNLSAEQIEELRCLSLPSCIKDLMPSESQED